MPRQQSPRTAALLEIVDELLRDLAEPIHYRELTKVLIDSGLWKAWGAEPDQILYSALHNEVKKYSQEGSRFLFLGGGIFCSFFVEGAEFLIPELPVPSDNDAAKVVVEHTDKRCGTCRHLSWNGPNIVSHEVGSCNMYSQTRRSCVFKKSLPCELWGARSLTQVNNDRLTPQELIVEAEHIRATGERPRNSKWKERV